MKQFVKKTTAFVAILILSACVSTGSYDNSLFDDAEISSMAALQDGGLLNDASESLLSQMDVTLTETGRRTLNSGRYMAARAETGYARGVAAEALRSPHPRGLSAWIAAGAGTIRPPSSVPPTGTTTRRPTGAMILVSASSAPGFRQAPRHARPGTER